MNVLCLKTLYPPPLLFSSNWFIMGEDAKQLVRLKQNKPKPKPNKNQTNKNKQNQNQQQNKTTKKQPPQHQKPVTSNIYFKQPYNKNYSLSLTSLE